MNYSILKTNLLLFFTKFNLFNLNLLEGFWGFGESKTSWSNDSAIGNFDLDSSFGNFSLSFSKGGIMMFLNSLDKMSLAKNCNLL